MILHLGAQEFRGELLHVGAAADTLNLLPVEGVAASDLDECLAGRPGDGQVTDEGVYPFAGAREDSVGLFEKSFEVALVEGVDTLRRDDDVELRVEGEERGGDLFYRVVNQTSDERLFGEDHRAGFPDVQRGRFAVP